MVKISVKDNKTLINSSNIKESLFKEKLEIINEKSFTISLASKQVVLNVQK